MLHKVSSAKKSYIHTFLVLMHILTFLFFLLNLSSSFLDLFSRLAKMLSEPENRKAVELFFYSSLQISIFFPATCSRHVRKLFNFFQCIITFCALKRHNFTVQLVWLKSGTATNLLGLHFPTPTLNRKISSSAKNKPEYMKTNRRFRNLFV